MDDIRCPKCGQNMLRTHSILVDKPGSELRVDIAYEWECSWCGHTEGQYATTAEARQDYERKYGGNKNV